MPHLAANCTEHTWKEQSPDRASSSFVWKYARKFYCEVCDAARWQCGVPRCSKSSIQLHTSRICVSNVSSHLLHKHGISAKKGSTKAASSTQSNAVSLSMTSSIVSSAPSSCLKQLKQTTLEQSSSIEVAVDAAQEGRLKLLRFLVHNKLPFTILDDPTWHQLAAFRISTISSTAIKRVLQQS